jgi:hypothetical protein
MPGRPITPARLGERLRSLGIYVRTGGPRASALPPSCPSRSLPTCSACMRQPRPSGCTKPEVTGPGTPLSSPALALTSHDEYLLNASTPLQVFSMVGRTRVGHAGPSCRFGGGHGEGVVAEAGDQVESAAECLDTAGDGVDGGELAALDL